MTTRKRLSTTERRHHILTAARAHFRRATYAEVSVPSIAGDAGSSQALIYHYFRSKSGLHTAVVVASLDQQRQARCDAVTALEAGQPVRYRTERLIGTHLDAIPADPLLLAGPAEPESTLVARRQAEAALGEELRSLIGIGTDNTRHRWAVTGIIGFLHRAAETWAHEGFPGNEREPLVAATLGALEGALGDWQV